MLLDSTAAFGVLSKKRSSSHKLQRVIQRYDALELAAFVKPYYAFVRFHLNPADRPSRWQGGWRPKL